MTIDPSHLRSLLAAASPVPFDDEGSARIIDRDGSLVATATGETRELRGRNRDLLVGAVNALESLLDVYEAACTLADGETPESDARSALCRAVDKARRA